MVPKGSVEEWDEWPGLWNRCISVEGDDDVEVGLQYSNAQMVEGAIMKAINQTA